jgi:hypothetical protein
MPQDFECKVSVNLLLEAAHRLFSYDKVPFALTLIHVVLEQYPDHKNAHKFYQMFTGNPVPPQPISKNHRLHFDPETEMFVVEDTISGKTASFKTFEEADAYLRGAR